VSATNSNGMTTPHSHPAKTNTLNTNNLDFPTGQRQRKAVSTVTAQLALHGHAVHALMCGDFLVCKYGLSYYAQDFEALQAFAKKLGVMQ
jgi:hypothetical protein